MKYKITTEYSFDSIGEWSESEIEKCKEEEKRGFLLSEEIESVTAEDRFPQKILLDISGKQLFFSENSGVEYEIVRIVEIETKEEKEKLEKWNKSCSKSDIKMVEA
jgi:hypothetical protein